MKICAIIPTHNHYKAVSSIITRLKELGLPVFLIDDGSTEPARNQIAVLQGGETVTVKRFDHNQGKGVAVREGFRLAIEAGFTHAIQIDADGQHDIEALPGFIEAAKTHPTALVSGKPVYDASAPMGRKIGRWATHIWVFIETLSFRISDSMCGLRIYPLDAVKKLLADEPIGDRMDFDTDIMVRLFWRGTPPLMLPVRVIYPPENTSNFDLWMDNVRITIMHARLFFTMLFRLPKILRHRPPPLKKATHWSGLQERGTYFGIKFCATAYRLLGRNGCRIVIAPIVIYIYLTGRERTRASRAFLTHALKRPSTWHDGFRQHLNFAMRAIDVLGGWEGKIRPTDIIATNPAELAKIKNDPRGGLLVVSHLGNVDIARAALDKSTRDRMTILVHTRHAENYNRTLQKLYPDAGLNLFQVTEMGPAVVIALKQRIEAGHWVVIAGDRTSVESKDRSSVVPFLGYDAALPQGPWILAALLECQVTLLFCLAREQHYDFTVEPFADNISLPRHERDAALRNYAAAYAERLGHYASLAPHQWYNFYDFWARAS